MDQKLKEICMKELGFADVKQGAKQGVSALKTHINMLFNLISRHPELDKPNMKCLQRLNELTRRSVDERAIAAKLLEVMEFHFDANLVDDKGTHWELVLSEF